MHTDCLISKKNKVLHYFVFLHTSDYAERLYQNTFSNIHTQKTLQICGSDFN